MNPVSQLHLAAATRCVQPFAHKFTHPGSNFIVIFAGKRACTGFMVGLWELQL